jgi:hypothetical protein
LNVYRLNCIFIVLLVLATAACGEFDASHSNKVGGSGSVPKPVKSYGTCDRSDVAAFNLCAEMVGSDYNDQAYLDILKSSCESTGGLYSANNCDRTGSLGTCRVAAGLSNEAHVTFYPGQYDAAGAQAECAAEGGEYAAN